MPASISTSRSKAGKSKRRGGNAAAIVKYRAKQKAAEVVTVTTRIEDEAPAPVATSAPQWLHEALDVGYSGSHGSIVVAVVTMAGKATTPATEAPETNESKVLRLMQYHSLDDVGRRMWGCELPQDVEIYSVDGKTVQYRIEGRNYIIGRLPPGYTAVQITDEFCEFPGFWVVPDHVADKINVLDGFDFVRSGNRLDAILSGKVAV